MDFFDFSVPTKLKQRKLPNITKFLLKKLCGKHCLCYSHIEKYIPYCRDNEYKTLTLHFPIPLCIINYAAVHSFGPNNQITLQSVSWGCTRTQHIVEKWSCSHATYHISDMRYPTVKRSNCGLQSSIFKIAAEKKKKNILLPVQLLADLWDHGYVFSDGSHCMSVWPLVFSRLSPKTLRQNTRCPYALQFFILFVLMQHYSSDWGSYCACANNSPNYFIPSKQIRQRWRGGKDRNSGFSN